MNTLTDLFPKAKAEIFRLLFAQEDQENHLRDLARLAELSPAALQKELTALTAKELVLTRRDGNRLYYRANPAHPLYPELRGMALKTSGIAAALTKALADIPGIDTALIFGSVAAGSANSQSDIDVLILGHIGLRKLAPVLRKASESLGREINPLCFTPEEWRQKLSKGDALALRVTAEPKLMLKGGTNALAAMAG
jgi:predicted nucleotidyltransferase